MKKILAVALVLILTAAILVSCGFEEEQQRVIANVYLPDVEAFNTSFYSEHSPTRETQQEIQEKKITNWLPLGTWYYDQNGQSKSFSATFEVTSVDFSINTAYFSYVIHEPDGTELASDGIVSAGCERMTEKGQRIVKIYVDDQRCLEFTGVTEADSAIYRRNSTKYKLTSTAQTVN